MRALSAILTLAMLGIVAGVSSPQGANRQAVNLPGRADNLPFSNAALVGNTLYLAGTMGIDPSTGRSPASIAEEAQCVMDNVKKILAEAGMIMDELVSVTVYCPDLNLCDRFNTVYRTYFTKEPPARAFIGSGPLLRSAHFEVQGIAVKR